MTFEEIKQAAIEARADATRAAWTLGDCMLAVSRAMGDVKGFSKAEAVASFAAEIGMGETAALKVYMDVSEAFPPSNFDRQAALADPPELDVAYIIFRTVLPVHDPDERHEWIMRAADEQLSASQLARLIRGEPAQQEQCECTVCGKFHAKAA